jgi:hypothetical protein
MFRCGSGRRFVFISAMHLVKSSVRSVTVAAMLAAGSGCFLVPGGGGPPEPRVVRVDTTVTPPRLPAEAMVEERSPDAPRPLEPAATRPITLSAVNADVRPLLIGIAREAGIDLVVTSDVNQRVSINLQNVPAPEAIAAIADAAGLTVTVPRQRELPAVVFYQLPVDMNSASAETIALRWGVSIELATFVVRSRTNPWPLTKH